MELSVSERLVLLNILQSTQGDLTTLRIVRDLSDGLSFDEEEHAKFKIAINDGSVTWDQSAATGKTIEIGDKAKEVIVKAFDLASGQGTLTLAHLAVYERFEQEVDNGA